MLTMTMNGIDIRRDDDGHTNTTRSSRSDLEQGKHIA